MEACSAMKFEPLDISKLSTIISTFASAEDEVTHSTILLATFQGDADDSEGQDSFCHIRALLAANMVAVEPYAVILDLKDLKYEWGDGMARVLNDASRHPDEPTETIPVAVVTSPLNREGLMSLLVDEMSERPEDWLFNSLEVAFVSIQYRLKLK
jgi:hypothetical protein